jgi:hypothetical protein
MTRAAIAAVLVAVLMAECGAAGHESEVVILDPVTILDHFRISRYNRPVVTFLVSMQAEV